MGNWDLRISKNPNADEIDGIYLATSRRVWLGKTELPDYHCVIPGLPQDIKNIYVFLVCDRIGKTNPYYQRWDPILGFVLRADKQMGSKASNKPT